MTTARDSATARSLGVSGVLLVSVWAVIGAVLVAGRVLLSGQPTPGIQNGWVPVLVSASILSVFLWLGSFAVLALGLAVSVAALVLLGRPRRAVVLLALLTLSAATQYLLEIVRSTTTWDLHPDHVAEVATTTGTFVAALTGLVVTVVLLAPALRRARSTTEPAAAG